MIKRPMLIYWLVIHSLLCSLSLFLPSCRNFDKSQNSSADPFKGNMETYPVKELIIGNSEEGGWGADLRLSVVSVADTDTSRLYTAVSTYQGRKLGLLVSIPGKEAGKRGFGSGIYLKSIGPASDNLLQVLATLYKQPADSGLKFANSISVSYVNLNEFVKSLGGEEDDALKTQRQYKLFFEGSSLENYGELYLNINPAEHWLELQEKDEGYRSALIQSLKQ